MTRTTRRATTGLTLALALMLTVLLASSAPSLAQSTLAQYSGGGQVTLTGALEKPEGTTYQYGTHGISDQYQGYFALQGAGANLDAYIGQTVEIYGTLVPGYENGQVEGGPPLVEVTRVSQIGGSEADKATLGFELTVEDQSRPRTPHSSALYRLKAALANDSPIQTAMASTLAA